MKKITKIILVVVLTTFGFQSFAQCEKGKVLVGGDSKFSFTSMDMKIKDDNDERDYGKSIELEFSPQVGYFVVDNLALGLAIPVSMKKETDIDDNEEKTTSFAVAPFARYYFGTTNAKPFLQGLVGFGGAKYTYDFDMGETIDTKMSLFLWEVGGGVAVFLNESIGIDIGVAYGSSHMKPKENNDDNAKIISSGFALHVGFALSF